MSVYMLNCRRDTKTKNNPQLAKNLSKHLFFLLQPQFHKKLGHCVKYKPNAASCKKFLQLFLFKDRFLLKPFPSPVPTVVRRVAAIKLKRSSYFS